MTFEQMLARCTPSVKLVVDKGPANYNSFVGSSTRNLLRISCLDASKAPYDNPNGLIPLEKSSAIPQNLNVYFSKRGIGYTYSCSMPEYLGIAPEYNIAYGDQYFARDIRGYKYFTEHLIGEDITDSLVHSPFYKVSHESSVHGTHGTLAMIGEYTRTDSSLLLDKDSKAAIQVTFYPADATYEILLDCAGVNPLGMATRILINLSPRQFYFLYGFINGMVISPKDL